MTLIANYIPLESPDGGPNFYEFGDDVLYEINIDNNGDGFADITYQFQFHDRDHQSQHLPLQHRPDHEPHRLELEPSADLHRVAGGEGWVPPGARVRTSRARPATSDPSRPPTICRWSRRPPPHWARTTVFAGQRAEGFYVDLGAIFDLGILRPFEEDHTTFGLTNTGLGQMAAGVNSTAGGQRPQHRPAGPHRRAHVPVAPAQAR